MSTMPEVIFNHTMVAQKDGTLNKFYVGRFDPKTSPIQTHTCKRELFGFCTSTSTSMRSGWSGTITELWKIRR